MQMLYEHSEEDIEAEIISICINLAANKRNAQLMCEGDELHLMAKCLAVSVKSPRLLRFFRE